MGKLNHFSAKLSKMTEFAHKNVNAGSVKTGDKPCAPCYNIIG